MVSDWLPWVAAVAMLGGCVPAATADQASPGGPSAGWTEQQPPVTSFPGAGEAEGEAACKAAVARASGRGDVVVLSSQLTHVGRQVSLSAGGQQWSCIAAADGSVFDVIRVGG